MPIKFTTKGYIELFRGADKVSQHTSETEAVERAVADSETTKATLYTLKYPTKELDLSRLTRVVLDVDVTRPSTPTGLTATAAGQTQINLSWTASTDPVVTGQASTGVAGYRIYRSSTANGTYTLRNSTTGTTFSDTGLSASQTWHYKVAAYDGAATPNESVQTTSVSATTAGSGTINVSTEAQLQSAIASANAAGNTTIALADGTYTLTQFLNITGNNITVRSQSGNRANVIVQGDAMSAAANIWFIFRVDANGFTVRDITMQRVRNSLLQIVGENNRDNGLVQNCILQDSYEHMIKVSIGANNSITADNWTVRQCLFGYTAAAAPNYYTGGIDAHGGDNWLIEDNTFQNIASPATTVAEHAIHVWDGAANCTIQRNLVMNCDRGIGYGLSGSGTFGAFVQSSGGVIKNNMIYHANNGAPFGDVSIDLQNTTGTECYNNTVYALHSYTNAIEYRFTSTTGVVIRNNLTNKPIALRDGATGTVNTNVTNAQASYFVNPTAGDLNLASAVAGVVDAGATITSVTDDFGGTSRPQGTAYDIGADERISTTNLLDLPLVTSSSNIFTYIGSFSIPATIKQDNGVGSGGLALSADGNSMYVTSFFGSVAKMSVPSTGTGTSSLQIGWTSTPGSGGPNQNKLSALEYGGQVYCTKYSTYSDQAQSGWIQRGTTSLGGFTGLSATSGQNSRLFCQALMLIPSAWQSLLGGPVAAIGSRLSIISNAQCGYGFVVFDPANVGSNVPVTPLLNYPYTNALEPGDSGFPGWSSYPKNSNGGTDLFSSTNAYVANALIVPGSRSLLFITAHGYGVADNGCRNGSSVHNDPNRMQIVAYDLRDLVAVKNGTMQPYAPRPYAWWQWQTGYGGIHWNNCVGGVPMEAGYGVYDQIRSRWYMCTDMFGNNMHSWTVNSL